MTSTSKVATGIAALPGTFGFAPPRRARTGLAGPGAVATALLRVRHLLARLRDRRRGPGGGDDRPPAPRPEGDIAEIWDDPAMWMLMIH